jgi:hypothetical protein
VTSAPRLLSWSEVVELADQALYLAKNGGRNAWAALYSTATTRHEGLFSYLMQDLQGALDEGEVMLVSSMHVCGPPCEPAAALEEVPDSALWRQGPP